MCLWSQLQEKLHIKSWVSELFPHSVTTFLKLKKKQEHLWYCFSSFAQKHQGVFSALWRRVGHEQKLPQRCMASPNTLTKHEVTIFDCVSVLFNGLSISALCKTLLHITTHVCPLWTYHTIMGSCLRGLTHSSGYQRPSMLLIFSGLFFFAVLLSFSGDPLIHSITT